MNKLIPKHLKKSPIYKITPISTTQQPMSRELFRQLLRSMTGLKGVPIGPEITVVADSMEPKIITHNPKLINQYYKSNARTLKEALEEALESGYKHFVWNNKVYKASYAVKGKNRVATNKANNITETIGDLPNDVKKDTGLDKVNPNTPLNSPIDGRFVNKSYQQVYGLNSPALVDYKNHQFLLYGITPELALDKLNNSLADISYLYLPFGDYNITETFENIALNKKLFQNGQPTWDRDKMPKRNRIFDHARIDLRNLAFGYPLLYNTFGISPYLMNSSLPYFLQDATYNDTKRAYLVKTVTNPINKSFIVLSDGAVNPYFGVSDNATKEEINNKRGETLAKTFRNGFTWHDISEVSPHGESFTRVRLGDNRFFSHPIKRLTFSKMEPEFIFDTSVNTNVRPMDGEDSYGTSIIGRGLYPNGVPYSSHYDEWDLGFSGIPGINTGNTLFIYNRKSDEKK